LFKDKKITLDELLGLGVFIDTVGLSALFENVLGAKNRKFILDLLKLYSVTPVTPPQPFLG